jgi:uncharacterized protein (DUF2336 family)
LWYATDILIAGRYNDEEVWVFGEVIGRLADEIEVVARAKLAEKLAHSSNAPLNIVMVLAFDDSIEVAGPILQYSERLNTDALVNNIKTKGQPHLLAISKRGTIPTEVTDELVRRGNREVVRSVASNEGARFSDFGFLHMVKRSESDSILAHHLCLRKEIPRHLFQQLISKASDDVRRKLAHERPDLADLIQTSVTDITGNLQSKFGPATKSYFAAKKSVTALHQHGNLNEARIVEYARSHATEEAIVGLSLLCTWPVDIVERALLASNGEMILILAKALNFAWETAMALLFLGAKDHCISARALDYKREEFLRLTSETSQRVLKLYRSRKSAASTASEQRRLPQLYGV